MRKINCAVCGFEPLYMGSFGTFIPRFCCESRETRKVSRKKRAHK